MLPARAGVAGNRRNAAEVLSEVAPHRTRGHRHHCPRHSPAAGRCDGRLPAVLGDLVAVRR